VKEFNWDDLRYFVELVRTRSPSEAARRLKADHTTVRRRVSALEDALRTRLFASRGQEYELTPEGEQLLSYAVAMEAMALRARDEIANSDLQVAGSVRIGVPEGFGSYFLGPRMAVFGASHPNLKIHLAVLPRIMNLSNREADVAIAYSPPEQLRQIVRRLTDYKLYIYASRSYLERHAPIEKVEDLREHAFIGYIPDLIYAPQLDYLTELPVQVASRFEATSVVTQARAVIAGAGLCILPGFIAAVETDLVPVLPEEFNITRQFWLVIHPDSINLTRVRTVINQMAEIIRLEQDLFRSPKPRKAIGASGEASDFDLPAGDKQ
jgi:DNA-binding transcriptional LysR family regulator